MSDPEDDREFLDEIKALEDVLANEESSHISTIGKDFSIYNLTGGRRANLSSRGFGEVEPQREDIETNHLKERQSTYETNKKLIELLQQTRRELMTILETCVRNKRTLNEKIRTRASNSKSSRVLIYTAGMPYFKDTKHYPAPWNNNVKTKMKNAELQVVQLRYTCPWTAKDRNILWRAIRQEAAAAVLENERMRGTELSVTANNNDDSDNKVVSYDKSQDKLAKSLNLPKNFKAMIGPLGTREFDWLKIAAMDFDNRHTADECRVMWQVFLHPDINRYRWTKEEDTKINSLSEKYMCKNWDKLAEELDSQRSGYQCFIRYNSINRTICPDENTWSDIEDEQLRKCVKTFKIGHYIPWGTVARYVAGRNKNQVYYRWMYNAAPHLKKGRFTRDEDMRLVEAVQKYGKNFCKISTRVMTNRSSVQLSDHYHTLSLRNRGVSNSWNINEDARLLILYNKYGPDWSSIARKICSKTRTQVRHRYKAIIRYWDKGVSLYEIPRAYKKSCTTSDDVEDIDLIERLNRERIQKNKLHCSSDMELIDIDLIKHFQLIPSALQSGRKRKYYRDDELEDTTRKLCIILKALNANLVIPEEFEERALTEKDKQLLNSLKDLQSKYAQFPTGVVQYRGIYDTETTANDGEKHFAPLCSGGCKQKEKLRWHDKIDYEPPPTMDHCQITLNMKLHTPTMIVTLVGDERNSDFQKLVRILISRKLESRKPNIVEKVRVLEPQARSNILSTVAIKTLSLDSETCEAVQTTNRTTNKKARGTKRDTAWNSSISDGIIRRLDQPFSCIEPNYYTLLGLQHIISKAKTTFVPDLTEQVFATSEESTRSMKILKKRLVQLFKYPIGLSHIRRPEIYIGGNIQSTELDNNDAPIREGIPDGCPKISSPPTKRTRL